ncbi:MAG: hypothetical protein IKE93_01485 [Erysipelotrichaceae bacterium]|nr:hypothetical protein [Erysipelotrichaceae bacterium]
MRISADILKSYEYPDIDIDDLLAQEIEHDDHVFVVLDDDPTGVQTVHDVSVYTDWQKETLISAFRKDRLFFVLTNSRGLSAEETTQVHKLIVENVTEASRITGKKYFFISRGDSTLRGHYPLETDLLCEGLVRQYGKADGDILFPFFKEGNRFTLNDIHYVRYGNELVPCGETEFAEDQTFGYVSSDLKAYIEEKCQGTYKKEEVISITLEELRKADTKGILEKLLKAENHRRIIVNAIDYIDVKVFCLALYKAIARGKVFMFRTAASFVRCVGGISEKPLLKKEEMVKHSTSGNGGIVVVGSHTDNTTRQLNKLMELDNTVAVAFKSSLTLQGSEAIEKEIARCLEEEERIIQAGKIAVAYTERQVMTLPDDTKEKALARSVKISECLLQLVKRLNIEPSFVVAKGGITSADVGVKALAIRKARVAGQIQPGVPVWIADETSKFPDIPYVIFPGNVGDDETLYNAVKVLVGE